MPVLSPTDILAEKSVKKQGALWRSKRQGASRIHEKSEGQEEEREVEEAKRVKSRMKSSLTLSAVILSLHKQGCMALSKQYSR